ncbi:FGGY-family carbohydrate kinase [soil metagenome]
MAPGSLLLGVDVGTQSTKGVVATDDGVLVATATRAHGVDRPAPGFFEHDADAVWWDGFVAVTRELLARDDVEAARVAGVGVSGIGPCLLAADDGGRPLRPAILYGVDTRAGAQIDELRERFGDDAIQARSRSVMTSQAVGPKLLWLREREPQVWDQTRQVLMASSFLVRRLTGAYVLDHHSASGVVPFYDAAGRRWHRPWVEQALGGDLRLPELAWSDEVAGEVTADAAAATGLRPGTPVTTGTVDAAAEALSAGVREPGDLMLMYGTTMFLIQLVERLPADTPFWGTCYLWEGLAALAGGMATSGALTSWFRDVLGEGAPPYESLVAGAARVRPGSDGLVVLPYFAGERTPLHEPDARGVVAGLTLDHGRDHLYRALLEATAYGVRHNLEALEAAGAPPARLVGVGGGTQGGLWPQIVADVTGRPQDVPGQTIGAAYGDALLAGIATGLVDRDADWNPPAVRVEPDQRAAAIYHDAYALYRELHVATAPLQRRLARLGREEPRHG